MRLSLIALASAVGLAAALPSASVFAARVKAPIMEDAEGIRRLLMPDDVSEFLREEFPGSRLPECGPCPIAHSHLRILDSYGCSTFAL